MTDDERPESDDGGADLGGVVEVPETMVRPLADVVGNSSVRVLAPETIERFGELKRAYDETVREVAEMRQRAAADIKARGRAVLEEARQRGYRDGFDALTGALRERSELRREARREATELAFEVAERVVGRILEADRQRVFGMIGELVREHAGGDGVLEISVHPKDKPLLEGMRTELREASGGQRVRLNADETIKRGGCLLRTGGRRIDARIDVRLSAMKAAILDE